MCKPQLALMLTSIAAKFCQTLGYNRLSLTDTNNDAERQRRVFMFWQVYIYVSRIPFRPITRKASMMYHAFVLLLPIPNHPSMCLETVPGTMCLPMALLLMSRRTEIQLFGSEDRPQYQNTMSPQNAWTKRVAFPYTQGP